MTATTPTRQPDSPPPKLPSRLRNRLVIPFLLLIMLSFSGAATVYLHTSQSALDDALSTRLTGLSQLVAGQLRPDYLKRLRPGDEQTRLYLMMMNKLIRLKEDAGVADIFIIDRQGQVLLDADQELPIGGEYMFLKLDSVELDRVWRGGSTASTLYAGDDGTLYKSGYAPIVDADGTVFAAVGVEAGADFLEAVRDLRRNVLLLVAIVVLMTALVSTAVARSIVGPIKRLVSAIGQVRGDGDYPTVSISSQDEVGYLSQAFNNMTQRLKEKDTELTRLYELERDRAERIEDLSDLVFEGIPNGVIAIDLSARVLLCNSAAAGIVPVAGYPFPETGIPPDAADSLGAESPVLRCLMGSLQEKKEFSREDAHFTGADGTDRVLGISAFPLTDRESRQVGAIAIFSDRTRLTRLQEQIKINERLAALGELSAGIAHEVRNPLGAIRGFVELLGRRVTDERSKALVANVLDEVTGLNHIVTDFLTFAREPAPVPEPVAAAHLLEDALATALPEEVPGIEVNLSLATDLSTLILDPVQVRQALVNIIQNAVNAMAAEGGLLSLAAREKTDGVLFQITDTGPGIPDDLRGKVFNPFFTTRAEGTGLGLSIANKVVEAHGGRISLENVPAGGTRFNLWFPQRPVVFTHTHDKMNEL